MFTKKMSRKILFSFLIYTISFIFKLLSSALNCIWSLIIKPRTMQSEMYKAHCHYINEGESFTKLWNPVKSRVCVVVYVQYSLPFM